MDLQSPRGYRVNRCISDILANCRISEPPRVAILREEGSNGDREMAAAFMSAGFEAYDLTMTDLMENAGALRVFDGIAFVGGFSYADVLGSAKGWSAAVKFHSSLYEEFEEFRRDPKKFSLGICNGCQIMALLGWIGTGNRAKRYATCFKRH